VAGVLGEHQGDEPVDFGFVGHQSAERSTEPDRLGGQVDPSAVALVEDQVDDGENRSEAVGQEMVGWDPERDAGRLDLRLGPGESALHGLGSDEEGVRDLFGRQPAERSQGQRDLRFGGQGGMAAHEDELQALVGDRRVVRFVLHRLRDLQQRGLGGEGASAS
jgi:hypothetical protein